MFDYYKKISENQFPSTSFPGGIIFRYINFLTNHCHHVQMLTVHAEDVHCSFSHFTPWIFTARRLLPFKTIKPRPLQRVLL